MIAIDMGRVETAVGRSARVLSEARTQALADVVAWVNTVTATITGPVPDDEKISWASKEEAARAFLASEQLSASQTALLTGEAAVTGETVASLSARIVANADLYRAAIATLTGLRRRAFAAITIATTSGQIDAALVEMKSGWPA
jgi:hypothetical protein